MFLLLILIALCVPFITQAISSMIIHYSNLEDKPLFPGWLIMISGYFLIITIAISAVMTDLYRTTLKNNPCPAYEQVQEPLYKLKTP